MGSTPAKHPDQVRAKSLVQDVLSETRQAKGWQVDMLDYDFYSSGYKVKLTLNANSAVVKLPSEMFDDVWQSGDKFKRRRIKSALRDAVKPFCDLGD